MIKKNYLAWEMAITPIEKLVLLFLYETCDYYGRVEFSAELLSSKCSVSVNEIRQILESLDSKKLIILTRSQRAPREIETWLNAIIIGGNYVKN